MKSGEMAMTENEAIDFIKNEINVMVLQRNGAFGSPAANIFRTRNGAKRIETLEVIIGLITQLKQYQDIGTVEECREAMEKQKGMQVNEIHTDEYFCPACGSENNNGDFGVPGDHYCPICGQAIYW